MKRFAALNIPLLLLVLLSCNKTEDVLNKEKVLDDFMSQWHMAAANADTSFFDYMAEDAIYIGTDASERWNKNEFVAFAIPYFKRGKAWDFRTRERRFYFTDNKDIAWFDETLDTWMGICRSSGVLQKYEGNVWKIKHYHLSCTVPNDKVTQFIELVNGKKEKQLDE